MQSYRSYQGDGLDIPGFLKRTKNVPPGLSHDTGSPHAGREPSVGQSTVMAPTTAEPHCRKRWPLTDRDKAVIAELQSTTVVSAKEKSYSRIDKLKHIKADRAAIAAGARWDARTARWL
jgi:hypothetical protein